MLETEPGMKWCGDGETEPTENLNTKKESIPVGCILPAFLVPDGGLSLWMQTPWMQILLDADPSSGCRTPPMDVDLPTPWRQIPLETGHVTCDAC